MFLKHQRGTTSTNVRWVSVQIRFRPVHKSSTRTSLYIYNFHCTVDLGTQLVHLTIDPLRSFLPTPRLALTNLLQHPSLEIFYEHPRQ